MEVLIFFILIVALFAALDVAALKWGQNSRQTKWINGGYDPRYDWNSQTSNWDDLDHNNANAYVRS